MKKFWNKQGIEGWYFIVTALVLFSIFTLYPILDSLVLSFQTSQGMLSKFNGLGNIKRLISDSMFHLAVKNTFTFLIIQVPIMLVLAIFMAVLLNKSGLKFKGFFRVVIFLPCVTSLVAYSVLFKMIFSQSGIVNNIFMQLNLITQPIGWLSDPFWAKVTIVLALLWRWTGYNMIFFLAALQNIPKEIYEAADIDGAGKIKQFFNITIPQLKPIILFTTIMSTIGTLQLFDEPMNLTMGGPANSTMTISQYIYNVSFVYAPNFGYASAISYTVVMMIALLSYIQFKVAGEDE
ncbi:MAG: carbohydrate ABC transporter permease [Fusobacteriaceae bacterium]